MEVESLLMIAGFHENGKKPTPRALSGAKDRLVAEALGGFAVAARHELAGHRVSGAHEVVANARLSDSRFRRGHRARRQGGGATKQQNRKGLVKTTRCVWDSKLAVFLTPPVEEPMEVKSMRKGVAQGGRIGALGCW